MTLFAASLALADDAADRSRLSGTWQSSSTTDPVWSLETKGATVHIKLMQGDKKLADFECNTTGRECEVEGHLKVTLYYNGPGLVELETKGSDVVKRRFTATAEDALDLEVTPIVPGGKTETLHLKRVQLAAATK